MGMREENKKLQKYIMMLQQASRNLLEELETGNIMAIANSANCLATIAYGERGRVKLGE